MPRMTPALTDSQSRRNSRNCSTNERTTPDSLQSLATRLAAHSAITPRLSTMPAMFTNDTNAAAEILKGFKDLRLHERNYRLIPSLLKVTLKNMLCNNVTSALKTSRYKALQMLHRIVSNPRQFSIQQLLQNVTHFLVVTI